MGEAVGVLENVGFDLGRHLLDGRLHLGVLLQQRPVADLVGDLRLQLEYHQDHRSEHHLVAGEAVDVLDRPRVPGMLMLAVFLKFFVGEVHAVRQNEPSSDAVRFFQARAIRN